MWLMPLVVIYFGMSAYNLGALYGDQTHFLEPAEMLNPELVTLRFWRDFFLVGFPVSMVMMFTLPIFYFYQVKKENQSRKAPIQL